MIQPIEATLSIPYIMELLQNDKVYHIVIETIIIIYQGISWLGYPGYTTREQKHLTPVPLRRLKNTELLIG